MPGAFEEDNPAKGLLTIAHSDQTGFFMKKIPKHTIISRNEDFSRFLSLKKYITLLLCCNFQKTVP
jgi:hypothetical protein